MNVSREGASRARTPLLDLDLLRTLVCISETGNFSAAAEFLHRTPSAVSVQVRRLEEIVGRALFVRDSRSVTLTDDGEVLLGYARRLMALSGEALAHFSEPSLAGTVNFGALDYVAEYYLPELLHRFAIDHPAVTVDVTVENSVELIEKFRRGTLDVAVVTCTIAQSALPEVELLRHEALVWAGATGGTVLDRDPLPISVWEEGCAWRESALAVLGRQNRAYRIAFKSASLSCQRAAVIADMAIAPLPLSTCGGGIIALDASRGLAALPDFALGMLVARDDEAPVAALAEHLRTSLSGRD